jgi:hypothetical protein
MLLWEENCFLFTLYLKMQSLTLAIAHVNVERKQNTTSVMIQRDNQAVRRVIHKFPCFFFCKCFVSMTPHVRLQAMPINTREVQMLKVNVIQEINVER